MVMNIKINQAYSTTGQVCDKNISSDWIVNDNDPNPLWPSEDTWRHSSESTLAQVMAWCRTAPSHYLNQSGFLVKGALWHSHEGNFTGNGQDIYPWYEFETRANRTPAFWECSPPPHDTQYYQFISDILNSEWKLHCVQAPGHQYPQCWLNIHCIGPVSCRSITVIGKYYKKYNHILKKFKG